MGCKNSKNNNDKSNLDTRSFLQAPIFMIPVESDIELAAACIKQIDTVRIEITAVFVDPNAPRISNNNHKAFKFINYKRPVAIRTLTYNIHPTHIDNQNERIVTLKKITTSNSSGDLKWNQESINKNGHFEIFDHFQITNNRPIIYINTKTMTWNTKDNNENIIKTAYESYPILHGQSSQAYRWFNIEDEDTNDH